VDQFPRDFGRQSFLWNLTPSTQTHPDHQLTFTTRFKISYCLAWHQEALFKDAAEIEVVGVAREHDKTTTSKTTNTWDTRGMYLSKYKTQNISFNLMKK